MSSRSRIFPLLLLLSVFIASQAVASEADRAKEILDTSGIRGGLVVHVGCGDGRLTAALRSGESYMIHGLAASDAEVEQARVYIQSKDLYGPVSVDRLRGKRLPYIDNLVNLVVAEDLGEISMDEVMRVLAPRGAACIRRDGAWNVTVKPVPDALDDWTHYMHDPSGNAVSHDRAVGPPRRMQWLGSPMHSRHHDRMSSVSAVVSAGGRVFYIKDEASTVSILIPPKWFLIARDAFNGTVLWKRKMGAWHTHLWPLKSGPAQLPRRLVARDDAVFVTLSIDGPLTKLDAATGEILRTYEGTRATEEVILSEGVLFASVNETLKTVEFKNHKQISDARNKTFWNSAAGRLVATNEADGRTLWTREGPILPGTLTADEKRVVFHDGESVVALDRFTGGELWRSEPVARCEEIRSFYLPALVLLDDVILFSGGEKAGNQMGSWYRFKEGEDTMTALSAETGEVLWNADHLPSGYRSPEDLLVVDGLVWTGENTSGRAEGVLYGHDLHTGEIKKKFLPDVETYWFHHRCYRGKATDRYLMTSRTGVEFIDVAEERWEPHHWIRGACLYGVMPANGLMYSPPNPCACYMEAMIHGFSALAPAARGDRITGAPTDIERLTRGTAYGWKRGSGARSGHRSGDRPDDGLDDRSGVEPGTESIAGRGAVADAWPQYRHDPARSGCAESTLPSALHAVWRATPGGRLTPPVAAEGRVIVASVDTHTVHAFDARSGEAQWRFTAGGRVDSPPALFEGRVLFGSADGSVYCLRASDGALIWRFLAAPMDQRLTGFEQLESVWPVHGSVLVLDGRETVSGRPELWVVAGRSMFLDDGLLFWRLDPRTGDVLSRQVLDETELETGKNIQDFVSWLNMPTARPDILSCDGRHVYMRSQPFRLDGTRLPLHSLPRREDDDFGTPESVQDPEFTHVFCPTGFLDTSWWHRTYWIYGSQYLSGWCGYYRAGKVSPAGRILVFDDEKAYGYGRKPQYYRWTTPIEHHLFRADKITDQDPSAREGSFVTIKKSKSLNPAGTPLTVEAFVKAQGKSGVILVNGGDTHGYALFLAGRKPRFALRIDKKPIVVKSDREIGEEWTHLAGVVNENGIAELYVDGELVARAKDRGFLARHPAEGLNLGADEGTTVGGYNGSNPLKGILDEVRIYARALSGAELARHAAAGPFLPGDSRKLVLRYSFEKDGVIDASGKGNDAEAEGVKSAEGRIGKGLAFTGRTRPTSDFLIRHDWTRDLPLFARALIKTGDRLFAAGPLDLVDEEEIFWQMDESRIQEKLREQALALEGKKGGMLMAIEAADGTEAARYPLENPPVFDGMITAGGKLFLATTAGTLVCFEGTGE